MCAFWRQNNVAYFSAYLSGIFSNHAAALAGPFPLVVLENDQRQTGEKSKSSASKFAENPDHSERHKVKKGDSLFKIINKYYADAGLDRNFLELAIVKANRGHLFAITQIFYMPAAFCTCHR